MDTKALKALSVVVFIAGGVLDLVSNIVSDKKQQADIDKAVAEAIKKQH